MKPILFLLLTFMAALPQQAMAYNPSVPTFPVILLGATLQAVQPPPHHISNPPPPAPRSVRTNEQVNSSRRPTGISAKNRPIDSAHKSRRSPERGGKTGSPPEKRPPAQAQAQKQGPQPAAATFQVGGPTSRPPRVHAPHRFSGGDKPGSRGNRRRAVLREQNRHPNAQRAVPPKSVDLNLEGRMETLRKRKANLVKADLEIKTQEDDLKSRNEKLRSYEKMMGFDEPIDGELEYIKNAFDELEVDQIKFEKDFHQHIDRWLALEEDMGRMRVSL